MPRRDARTLRTVRRAGDFATAVGLLLLVMASSGARAENIQVAALADLSLEELSNAIVTSVSGRREEQASAAASIYVIGDYERAFSMKAVWQL